MRLAASQPPEARGLGRDGVRLLVATPDGMVHAQFGDLLPGAADIQLALDMKSELVARRVFPVQIYLLAVERCIEILWRRRHINVRRRGRRWR